MAIGFYTVVLTMMIQHKQQQIILQVQNVDNKIKLLQNSLKKQLYMMTEPNKVDLTLVPYDSAKGIYSSR